MSQSNVTMNAQPPAVVADAPSGIVSGNITTTDKEPAAFVTVILKGTTRSAVTDENGFFEIKNVKEGSYLLVVSIVGLKSMEKTIDVKKDQTTFVALTLQEDARQLNNVIINTGRN